MEQQDNREQRVLVVEDEAVIGRVCCKVLTNHGFTVDVVPDGQKAINRLRKKCYDLCILDLRMPGINGIEVYKFLTDNYQKLSHSVVFTTGDIADSYVSRFLRKSERVCLKKPFTPQELLAAVELSMN